MQFVLDKDVYKVARITGPEHNFLGVRFAESSQEIDVVQLPIKSGQRQQVDRDSVLAQVSQGLVEVNAELGKTYAISQVHFVPSDSPSNSVYRDLTIELIKRVDRQEPFFAVSLVEI